MLCNLDPDYEMAAQKTSEALQLKDEHAKHLLEMLSMRQVCLGGWGHFCRRQGSGEVGLGVMDE